MTATPILLAGPVVEAAARALHDRIDALEGGAMDAFESYRDDWMADARAVLQAAGEAVDRDELAQRIAAVLHPVYLDGNDQPCQVCDEAAAAVAADLLSVPAEGAA